MNIENLPQRKIELKPPENPEQGLQREAIRLGINPEALNNPEFLAGEVSQKIKGEINKAKATIEDIQSQVNNPEVPLLSAEREEITRDISSIQGELREAENQFKSELEGVLEGDTHRREILRIAQKLIDQRLRLENLPEKKLTEMTEEELKDLFQQQPYIEDIYKEAKEIYRKREERRRKEEEYRERTYREAQAEREKFEKLKKEVLSIEPGQIFEDYEKDPRFQLIMQEMKVDWIERREKFGELPDFLSAQGQEFLYGRQDRPHDLSLKERALERFKKEFPDLWRRYEEIEKTRIYNNPKDDPAVREVERSILEITNRRFQLDSRKPWSDVYTNVFLHQWASFVERYPEKAKAYADKIQELSQMMDRIKKALERKRENQFIQESEEQIERPNFLEAIQNLTTTLNTADVEFNLTQYGNLGTIEIKREPNPEPQVVVYRGVNDPESILRQSPYAMRVIGPDGNVTINENLEPLVQELAQNPTYENLLKVYNSINEYYNGIVNDESVSGEVKERIKEEKRRLTEELREIENEVLNGEPLPKILIFRQIFHNRGIMEGGLTPYLSASINPQEAANYGSYLLVLSLTPNLITAINTQGKEIMIKGALSKENLIGIVIIPRGTENLSNLSKITENVIKNSGVNQITNIENILEEEIKSWEQNVNKDRRAVIKKRVRELIKAFSNFIVDQADEKKFNPEFREVLKKEYKSSKNLYTSFLRAIFEILARRIEELGGQLENFDKNKANEKMLEQLREILNKLEQKRKSNE